MTWITTSAFWNTQSQQVFPATRTDVSSEHTTRARRSRARIAPTSASKHGMARRNAASSAPSRYGKLRGHLFTFLDHPEVGADNNGSERELRPTATYRKVTGGFRSGWGKDLFAAFRSVVSTAARRGINAYQAVRMTLSGQSVLAPG